jgi:hypothetical protein
MLVSDCKKRKFFQNCFKNLKHFVLKDAKIPKFARKGLRNAAQAAQKGTISAENTDSFGVCLGDWNDLGSSKGRKCKRSGFGYGFWANIFAFRLENAKRLVAGAGYLARAYTANLRTSPRKFRLDIHYKGKGRNLV